MAVAVALIVVAAGSLTYYYAVAPRPSSSSSPPQLTAGAFAGGQVVTFVFNGSATFLCTPSLAVLFPHDGNVTRAEGSTSCGAGNASQSAVVQVPQWFLIPAFACLSVFGLTSQNATARGFPTLDGTPVLTDCGAGATPTACLDHPAVSFSPLFADFEARAGLPSGVESLPLGVLPFPAHDMVENFTSYPLVPWGTIFVYVLDPNILPDRATGVCSVVAPSNLSDPTANCLTSSAHIVAAASTCSSTAATFASAADNAVGWALTHDARSSPCAQVYIPSPGSFVPEGASALLNSNLYIPYSVTAGSPASFPT